jgi:Fe-S cluster biogenesis protein NfuA
MADLAALLDLMERRLAELDELGEPARTAVFEVLDGIDALHRLALARLAARLDPAALDRARADPAVGWLLDAYGVGVDERAAAEAALDTVRPYIHSHGGTVEVLAVDGGRVRIRMAGSCSGCTASAETLARGIESALRDHLPGFVAVEVEEDHGAAPHPPPAETFVELGRSA